MGRKVNVLAPARLHMGFLDLNGSLGRRYGSVGLAIEGIQVRLSAWSAESLQVSGPQGDRALMFAQNFLSKMGSRKGVHIEIHEAIPAHVGLGSGTQLALAVGAAINQLVDAGVSVRDIATLHERGQRSGIGVGVFENGGFVIDGGRATDEAPPPVIARIPFPDVWRVMLVTDKGLGGIHGEREVTAFQGLPPMSEAQSADLCRLMLMRTAPALVEGKLDEFGRGIEELQRVIGDHFASVQGGRFTSPRVAEVLAWLKSAGICGVGQSSWGPTGFAFVESEEYARSLCRAAAERWTEPYGITFKVLRGRNLGAEVQVVLS